MVFCTTIEVQIAFEVLFTLITSQLAIVGQLGGEIYLWRIRLFLGVEDNILEDDDLANEATRNIFALFRKAMVLPAKKALPYFQK